CAAPALLICSRYVVPADCTALVDCAAWFLTFCTAEVPADATADCWTVPSFFTALTALFLASSTFAAAPAVCSALAAACFADSAAADAEASAALRFASCSLTHS